jgi:hypothetical protein
MTWYPPKHGLPTRTHRNFNNHSQKVYLQVALLKFNIYQFFIKRTYKVRFDHQIAKFKKCAMPIFLTESKYSRQFLKFNMGIFSLQKSHFSFTTGV